MYQQPGHRPQPTATPAGQPAIDTAATAFLGEVEDALAQATRSTPATTAIRIEDPAIPSWQDGARIGTTPPVTDQPGTRRAAMSQRAVDLNTTLISISVVIGVTGAVAIGAMVASEHANATVIGWICACIVAVPAALALPVLALKGLMKSAKQVAEAAPPEIHQHYSGHVHQDHRAVHVHTKTNGAIAITRNQLPELPPANNN